MTNFGQVKSALGYCNTEFRLIVNNDNGSGGATPLFIFPAIHVATEKIYKLAVTNS
jgi:hypothetical protein